MNRFTRTVTWGGWGVSTETCSLTPGRAVLHVYKIRDDLPNRFGGMGRIQNGDAYGRVFYGKDSIEASDKAFAFALERGYTQPYFATRKAGGGS